MSHLKLWPILLRSRLKLVSCSLLTTFSTILKLTSVTTSCRLLNRSFLSGRLVTLYSLSSRHSLSAMDLRECSVCSLHLFDLIWLDLRYIRGSFLVYPTAMLYPVNLIYVNLFDVLHRSKGELLQGKRCVLELPPHSPFLTIPHRLRFFWIVVGVV